MSLTTEQRLAKTRLMCRPQIIELLDMGETTHQKVATFCHGYLWSKSWNNVNILEQQLLVVIISGMNLHEVNCWRLASSQRLPGLFLRDFQRSFPWWTSPWDSFALVVTPLSPLFGICTKSALLSTASISYCFFSSLPAPSTFEGSEQGFSQC